MSPTAVIEISRTHNPCPRQGVQADSHGIPRYTELPGSLIAMLARQVETGPQHIVVSGGPLPRNPGGKLLKAQLRKSVEWGAPL